MKLIQILEGQLNEASTDFAKMVKLLNKAGIKGKKQVNQIDDGIVSTEYQSSLRPASENDKLMVAAGFEKEASYGAFDLWERDDVPFKIQMERSIGFRIAAKGASRSNFGQKVMNQRVADE